MKQQRLLEIEQWAHSHGFGGVIDELLCELKVKTPDEFKKKRAPSQGRQLQGTYMFLLRKLSEQDREWVKKIRKEQSVNAAIEEAKRLLS